MQLKNIKMINIINYFFNLQLECLQFLMIENYARNIFIVILLFTEILHVLFLS